ncbi:transmembrane protein, putative [Bodo saltans]|uniref:Transmembrane protein, putative n=1 Tax=Bodo saltans TaxID=75058 RepID=A0A0S4JJ73_BODSA|nr:transmembrane protein, putative [Bodo saltans]|eukprot:CUG91535.1 transmembrane protein, putative [Bodo saltans]
MKDEVCKAAAAIRECPSNDTASGSHISFISFFFCLMKAHTVKFRGRGNRSFDGAPCTFVLVVVVLTSSFLAESFFFFFFVRRTGTLLHLIIHLSSTSFPLEIYLSAQREQSIKQTIKKTRTHTGTFTHKEKKRKSIELSFSKKRDTKAAMHTRTQNNKTQTIITPDVSGGVLRVEFS